MVTPEKASSTKTHLLIPLLQLLSVILKMYDSFNLQENTAELNIHVAVSTSITKMKFIVSNPHEKVTYFSFD